MYRAAEMYCRKLQLPLECRYLCCSRYSIRIPMYQFDFEEALDYICRGGIDVTMDKILSRAGLTEKEKRAVLEALGERSKTSPQEGLERSGDGKKDREHPDDRIAYSMLPDIRERLRSCGGFRMYLQRHSEEELPNLKGYLIQEGLLDGVPSALVDSGWVGSMQKVLNDLLDRISADCCGDGQSGTHKPRLEGYYWGLYELPEGVRAADYHCYYFSPGENLREKVYFSNCLFEGLFSAPHGMTLRYAREEIPGTSGEECSPPLSPKVRYRPVFAEISQERRSFMEQTENRLMEYTQQLAERIAEEAAAGCEDGGEGFYRYLNQTDWEREKKIIYRLLRIFMAEPTAEEAEIYGTMQFSDDVIDREGQQMAAPMNDEELSANHALRKIGSMLGIAGEPLKESAWYEGSAVLNGRRVQTHLRRYSAYKYLLYLRKRQIWSKRKDG
ncbi:MAG: hypothetical protein LIO96_14470 [Lachnospiraceae bacterium]|nr:hypothetical protein [Lachnospiraceae bacterium]